MSFLEKLKAIFAGKKIPAGPINHQPGTNPGSSLDSNSFIASWERKMAERAKALEMEVRDWIIVTVNERGTIPFTWESGNDEAFVVLTDFNPEPAAIQDTIWSMQEYIINSLFIPDAGEFQMNGKGEIYLKDNEVRIQHESVLLEIVDYDEEKGEPVYNESEDREGGDKLLFTI